MEGLFPKVPSDITKMEDKELTDLLAEFEHRAGLVQAEDKEFLGDRGADDVLAQFAAAKDTILALRAEVTARDEAAERYAEQKEAISAELKLEQPKAEEDAGESGDDEAGDGESGDGEEAGDGEDAGDEASAEGDGDEVEAEAGERELAMVAAADEPEEPAPVARVRRVPMPAADRVPAPVAEQEPELSFVAAGGVKGTPPGAPLKTKAEIASAVETVMRQVRVQKSPHGVEEHVVVASLDYSSRFPEERTLRANALASNGEKVAMVHEMFMGSGDAAKALVASGGICAPPTNIYTIPQLWTNDRPVRDALPNFRAERGGINVPTPPIMGDAAAAITVITADEDGQGGTFATKACLDLDCPTFTETAVTIIAHCREFGNLNAMSWPEYIAAQNSLTMAEHARIAESYLLGRLKTLSVNVTTGVDTLGAMIYLVDAIEKAEFGIRSRLRLPSETRFQLLAPRVLLDILELDTVSTQFDRFRSRAALEDYLNSIGVDVTWYLDTPLQVGDATAAPGTSQIADASQDAGALDGLPANVQLAFFPAGTFLHLDMASLELGIVRDSTLNSTNDFQIFGESFENVSRIGPAQAAYWITANLCPTGQFPPAGTARTCE